MATRTVDLGSVIGPQGPQGPQGATGATGPRGYTGPAGPAGADGMACRVARFVVGTSAAGWTADDCDYLCDGTADEVEINAAISALPADGGEIVLLDGTYNLTAAISMEKKYIIVRGNGPSTILTCASGANITGINADSAYGGIFDLHFSGFATGVKASVMGRYFRVARCIFTKCTTVVSSYMTWGWFCDNLIEDGSLYFYTGWTSITGNYFTSSTGTILLSSGNNVFVGNRGTASSLQLSGDKHVVVGNRLITSVTVSGTGCVNQNNIWT